MKQVKMLTILLLISSMLTGCFAEEKQIIRTPDNPTVISKPNNIQPETNQPQKTSNIEAEASKPNETIKPKETPKPKETSKPEETSKPKETLKEEESKSSPKNNVKEIDGFVLLTSLDSDIVVDLKYATTDNFTKKIIYPSKVSVLRKSTAEKLVKVNTELKKLGYRIKVWDGYRPVYVQQIFWDIVKDSRFVANPKNGGSIHNKGCAVDVTLVDKNGNNVNMPSKFDDFSINANRTNSKMTNEAKKNMNLLTNCMIDNGFTTINTEWWHFEDVDSNNYKIANINLDLFLEKN